MKFKSNLTKIDFSMLRKVYYHFGGHLKSHRLRLFFGFLALMGVTCTTLLNPWPLKLIFDYALIPGGNSGSVPFLDFVTGWEPINIVILSALGVILLAVTGSFLNYAQEMITKKIGHAVSAAIRLQLFSHIQRLPQSYHDYRETGEIITRLTGDVNLVQDLLVDNIIRLMGQFTIIIGMIIITFLLDWQLALLIIVVMPFFMFASFSFSRRIKQAAQKQRKKFGNMVASMEETLSGISQVKVFRQEKNRDKLIGKSVGRDYRAGLKTARLAANYSRSVQIISAIGIGLVLYFGAEKTLSGAISVGDLLIYVTYVRYIYRPIQTVSRLSAKIAKAVVRGEKIMEILDIEPEVKDRPNSISASKIKGDIEFDNVDFSYIENSPVLKHFWCRIPANKTTVIIGPTGAGKSTIGKLLLRLYEPQAGKIFLDGKDISEFRIQSLRKRITSLSQEAFLFRTSIRENIIFSKPRASDQEIAEAVNLVKAGGFIKSLPDGYDTLVGEGGLTLSGGQRQRISFARAALRNSPVMIFDEPVTGLDVHTEKEAKSALEALKSGRTMIIITHRLNFLEFADWAIYIREGQLVEQGIPLKLVDSKGGFYNFVHEEVEKNGYDGWLPISQEN